MDFKKKLYQLNPKQQPKRVELLQTRRNIRSTLVTPQSNERHVRESLASKLSGTHLGLWLLIPEYLRLGAWDLLTGTFPGSSNSDLDARLALQMVNESALCVNRLRRKDSLCNQGFALTNGLSFLATDESVHSILDSNSIAAYEDLQIALMKIRSLQGHYSPEKLLAIDPHRINSATARVMPAKKKRPTEPSSKMLQTFFCVDSITGQPLAFTIGSSGKNCTPATTQLMSMISQGDVKGGLVVADKEHYSENILEAFDSNHFEFLVPAPEFKSTIQKFKNLKYNPQWAGYALASEPNGLLKNNKELHLIVQREGERENDYQYKAFLTNSRQSPVELLTRAFPTRWTIEEFFNFNGKMGWDRASTFNLNVRYGRQTLALIAQAATHELKKKLPGNYRSWTADHLAQQVLTNMEGDIRVKDDTIIVTYYRDHERMQLQEHFKNLPEKLTSRGINPKIPWLFDYKLDFRFK